MRWLLYQFLMAAALVLAAPVLLLRRGGHYLPTLRGRLGLDRAEDPPRDVRRDGLWIHAVSVGEVGVAATLARHLPEDQPAVVTTVTPTGQERARAAFRDRSSVAYLPFDLGFAVRRFFRRFRPGALVLVEGDYWPLVLRAAARRGLPVAVVNGRIGDRSFRRLTGVHARAPWLLRPLFEPVRRFGVQTEEDARRLSALGVPAERVVVTGNLKYETPEPASNPEVEAMVGRLASGRPVLVAGSTMAGEEEQVAEAFERLGGAERALLVLAPRHPERWDEAAALVTASGLAMARRSEQTEDRTRTQPESGQPRPAVLLLDSLGELAGLYRMAAAAFIGGTLVPTGGHNPLEAARWGVPVAVGPSMENFRQIAREFDQDGAWARVGSPAELAAAWGRWLDQPDEAERVGGKGRALIDRNRGAAERTVAMLNELGPRG